MLKYLPELAFSHALQRLRIRLVLLGNSFCPLIICLPDRRLPVTHGGRQNVWKESSSIDQFISLSQTVWQQRTQTSVLTQYFSHPRNPALGNPFADEHTSPVERGTQIKNNILNYTLRCQASGHYLFIFSPSGLYHGRTGLVLCLGGLTLHFGMKLVREILLSGHFEFSTELFGQAHQDFGVPEVKCFQFC